MPHVGVVEDVWAHREAEDAARAPRTHLGASVIGKPCERALVYGFRHASLKRTSGRMTRLFERGHREEPAIIADLRRVGHEVREFAQRLVLEEETGAYVAGEWDAPDPPGWCDVSAVPEHQALAVLQGVKLRQWGFSELGGHYSGSSDGVDRLSPEVAARYGGALPANTWFGLEFKTANSKAFSYLRDHGSVHRAKPEHYAQMQKYMQRLGLPCTLYLSVCKNDDDYYEEVVPYRPEAVEVFDARAARAVGARQLPPRISRSATNFDCKFCDHRGTCHLGEPLIKSCRTCADAVAVVDRPGQVWHCHKWAADIPAEVVAQGCAEWRPMTD